MPRPLKEAKAVIFDMDGLLLDTERLFKSAYQIAINELGYDFPDEYYNQMIGHRSIDSQTILRSKLPPEVPVDEIIDSARRYYYTMIEKEGVPLKPGVMEVLDFFDACEMPMAVATSTHRELALSKLRAVHLLNRFTAVVSGDEVENGKPAPDIYIEAARLLGNEPANCLVLEDSPTGLKSGHFSGAIVIHIPDLISSNTVTQRLSQYSFNSLTEFLEAYKNSTT